MTVFIYAVKHSRQIQDGVFLVATCGNDVE